MCTCTELYYQYVVKRIPNRVLLGSCFRTCVLIRTAVNNDSLSCFQASVSLHCCCCHLHGLTSFWREEDTKRSPATMKLSHVCMFVRSRWVSRRKKAWVVGPGMVCDLTLGGPSVCLFVVVFFRWVCNWERQFESVHSMTYILALVVHWPVRICVYTCVCVCTHTCAHACVPVCYMCM